MQRERPNPNDELVRRGKIHILNFRRVSDGRIGDLAVTDVTLALFLLLYRGLRAGALNHG